jgi:fatty acid desaturase
VSQFDRTSPFSIWGLWGGLSLEQHLLEVLTVLLAFAVFFVPRQRTVVHVAALAAAIVIALQLCLTHWFYLYIPWFFPALIVALIGSFPSRVGHALSISELERREQWRVAAAPVNS